MTGPLIHGLCRLTLSDTGALTPAMDGGRPVLSVADLPEAEVDLHWFDDTDRARSFLDGVMTVASNVISAAQGEDALACAVVLVRHDRSPRMGKTLDEVIALVDHGGAEGSIWENLNQDAWRHVAGVLDAAPRKLSMHWRVGQGCALIEGMSQRILIARQGPDDYLLRPFSWSHRPAFDGRYGRLSPADTMKLNRLLDRFDAKIVKDDLSSTPSTVDLHILVKKSDLGAGLVRADELLGMLGGIHDVRLAAHERRKLKRDPIALRAAARLKDGGKLNRYGSKLFIVGGREGIPHQVTAVLLRRMADARMIAEDVVSRIPKAS
jgi:hypothetical protein